MIILCDYYLMVLWNKVYNEKKKIEVSLNNFCVIFKL